MKFDYIVYIIIIIFTVAILAKNNFNVQYENCSSHTFKIIMSSSSSSSSSGSGCGSGSGSSSNTPLININDVSITINTVDSVNDNSTTCSTTSTNTSTTSTTSTASTIVPDDNITISSDENQVLIVTPRIKIMTSEDRKRLLQNPSKK